MQYIDKNKLIKSLTKEEVTKLIMSLGSREPRQDTNGNLIFQTVCHGGDSYKLYYYHESNGEYKGRSCHCYTQCGESFSLIELVIRANRAQGKTITWYSALRYIAQITGKLDSMLTEVEDSTQLITDFEWINRLKAAKKGKRGAPQLAEINENILEMFYYAPHQEWINDHITREALSQYEIGYWGLTNQITIPHRDLNGRLLGIRGRYLDDEDVEQIGKYVPLQINGQVLKHSLGNNLYGLNVVKDKVEQIKKLMLVEAEKSCLQAYSYFGDDSFVCAVCGSNITKNQQKIILSSGVEELMIAFDREYEEAESYKAEAYLQKLLKLAAPFVPFMKVYLVLDTKNRIPYKASPTDCGKDILVELMKEKILITADMLRELL